MKKLNYDGLTGQETVTDLSAEQLAQYEIDKADAKAKQDEAKAKATAKAALLSRLGITAEEAVLLLS